jgi:saccharopine dehydrogenase-like NADP-dependent oxidoreductase
MNKPTVLVAGAGGIGQAVALLIAEHNDFDAHICLGDVDEDKAREAVAWIHDAVPSDSRVEYFRMDKDGLSAEMEQWLDKADVLLDCLPGKLAPRMARYALEYNMHYANLTEYVKETDEIVAMAESAGTGFVLQTGLAPGYINVLGNHLLQRFCAEHGVDRIDHLAMKVGALTRNATGPHYYGFTWSPIGVATEYLKDAYVIRDYKKTHVSALSEPERLLIGGIEYEDNFTSGGAADLPDALQEKVRQLDYKTIRYPGHYAWVAEQIKRIPAGSDKAVELERIMLDAIPLMEDDLVVVYASATGRDRDGVLRKLESSLRIPPVMIGRTRLRAIQATTAAPMVECARMLLENRWKGPVFQSQIDPEAFLNGPFIKRVYRNG